MIIAVDGPAGAGKSTVSKIIAKKLGFLYIDTGAMYRAFTLKIIEQKTDIKNLPELVKTAKGTSINLMNKPDGSLTVLLDGKDVTDLIREPRITKIVSDIAKIKEIREIMVVMQRKLGQSDNCILDGRDIGTVVFPKADRKFFLDAKFNERVNRRYQELKESRQEITQKDVEKDLHNRDTIDSSREHAPLRKADDAIYIDTTHLTIDEVVNTMLKEIKLK